MWMHYNINGDYQSFSHNQERHVNAYIKNSNLKLMTHKDINIKNIGKIYNVEVLIDINSLCHKINLDCYSCSRLYDGLICDSMFPLEVILKIDANFNVIKVLLFIDTEKTRLISMYGKYGHLVHCIDCELNNNQYIVKGVHNKCNKMKYFNNGQYKMAYLSLKNSIEQIFGTHFYSELKSVINNCNKIGLLF